MQKSSLDKHFQSCYCQKQVGQVGIDNYSSETYWQVIIFAWMYSPEGIDNRYTKRITGENVGSTVSVARNSHAMVTLVYFSVCMVVTLLKENQIKRDEHIL